MQLNAKSRRGMFAERPSVANQDRRNSLAVPPTQTAPGAGAGAGSQVSFAVGYSRPRKVLH